MSTLPQQFPSIVTLLGFLRLYFWIILISLSVLVVISAAVLIRLVFEAKRIVVRRAVLSLPHIDSRLEELRIVFAADMHAGPSMQQKSVAKLVEQINELEPDIVILGGDYVGGHYKGNEYFYSEIGGLSPRYGSFAVVGNHDYWETPDIASRMRDADITLLRNQNASVTINGVRLWVAGVDDLWEGTPDIEQTMKGIVPSDFAILVSHNPDFFADGIPGQEAGFDLALAGHTHGGQITAFGKAAYAPTAHGPRYLKDWRVENGIPILVTCGVGSVMVPLRFHAQPEIHLIKLKQGPLEIR